MGTTTLENGLELAGKVEDAHILLSYHFNPRNRVHKISCPFGSEYITGKRMSVSIIALNYPKLETIQMSKDGRVDK